MHKGSLVIKEQATEKGFCVHRGLQARLKSVDRSAQPWSAAVNAISCVHLRLIQQGLPVKQLQQSNTSLTGNNVLCQLYTAHLRLHRCTPLHRAQQQGHWCNTLSPLSSPEGADNTAALPGCWSATSTRGKHVKTDLSYIRTFRPPNTRPISVISGPPQAWCCSGDCKYVISL